MKIALRVLHAAAYCQQPSEPDVILLRAWVKVDNRNANPDELARLVIDDQLPPSRFEVGREQPRASRMRA